MYSIPSLVLYNIFSRGSFKIVIVMVQSKPIINDIINDCLILFFTMSILFLL